MSKVWLGFILIFMSILLVAIVVIGANEISIMLSFYFDSKSLESNVILVRSGLILFCVFPFTIWMSVEAWKRERDVNRGTWVMFILLTHVIGSSIYFLGKYYKYVSR